MRPRRALRRLRRWHQARRAARAEARVLNDLEWLGIETRRNDRERERGWK